MARRGAYVYIDSLNGAGSTEGEVVRGGRALAPGAELDAGSVSCTFGRTSVRCSNGESGSKARAGRQASLVGVRVRTWELGREADPADRCAGPMISPRRSPRPFRVTARPARRAIKPLLAAVSAVVALAAAPGVASADGVSIMPPADMVADMTQNVTVSGDAGTGAYLWLRGVNTATCPATHDQNPSADAAIVYANGNWQSGAFSRSMQIDPYYSGSLLLCAYLVAGGSESVAQQLVSVREPSGSLQLGSDPNPPVQEQQAQIVITGTHERSAGAVRLIVLDDNSECAAKPGDNRGMQVHDLTYDGEPASGNPFRVVVRYTPFYARPNRVCAYLVPFGSPDGHVDAFAQSVVTVNRFATGLSLDGDASPYYIGDRRTFTFHGSAAVASDYWEEVVSEAACPSAPHDGTLFSGPFDEPVSFTTTSARDTMVCGWIVHNGEVYASAQAHLIQVPLPVATPSPDSPRGAVRDRRASFRWSAPPQGATDTFKLSDGDGQPLFYADAKGARLPPDLDDERSFDPATGALLDPDTNKAARQPKRDTTDAASWVKPAGIGLTRSLPPGRYTWTVTRDRFDGARSSSSPISFRILGPPLTRLSVRSRDVRYSRSAAPGFTRLAVTTTPYVSLRLELRRSGRTRTLFLHWGARPQGAIDVGWTCKTSGGDYRYTLTARDDEGRTLTRRGTIRPISRARCQKLKAAEKRARDRRIAQRRRRQQEAERRRRAAERAELARATRNCHKLDGRVRSLELPGGGTTRVCLTPYGIMPLDNL
jgi:hypothetical protein